MNWTVCFCDYCREVYTLNSAAAKADWEIKHQHEEEDEE